MEDKYSEVKINNADWEKVNEGFVLARKLLLELGMSEVKVTLHKWRGLGPGEPEVSVQVEADTHIS